jgi:chromosomal replication initiator protein
MYLARQRTRYSLEEIGGYFGGRDHTTVMHAIKTITEQRGRNGQFAGHLERIEAGLTPAQAQSA